jgi:Fe-S-cluster containining protein
LNSDRPAASAEAQSAPCGDVETANIHLDMLGERRVFPVRVRLGPCTALDLLAPARELTMQATEVALAQARAQGRTVSCRAGCGACCRQLVAISAVEAAALAELVAAMPPERQRAVRDRFDTALRRVESAGLLDPDRPRGQRALQIEVAEGEPRDSTASALARRWFALRIPCPFLEDESCGIHPDRPLVCREYHVTSPPERCARLHETKIDSVAPPLHLADALARAAGRLAGVCEHTMPLPLALEWHESQGERLRQSGDGLSMFRALVSEIDRDFERPFDARGAIADPPDNGNRDGAGDRGPIEPPSRGIVPHVA